MQEFDIKGRTTVTATIKAQIDDSPLATPPLEGLGVESFQSFAEAANDSTDSLKGNSAILKEFGNIMPEIVKNLRYMNDIVARTNQNLPAIRKVATSEEQKQKIIDNYNRQNFMQLVNTGGNAVQSVANGNITGAAVGGINSIANTSNNLSKMADAAEMASLAQGLIAGGIIATVAGVIIKGADTIANKYMDEMPTIYGTGKAFGSVNDATAMRYWEEINQYNKGTGLDLDTFQGLATTLRKQGVGNGIYDKTSLVGDIAQTTARWAYATGGDANQYAQLAGLMSRYGGSKNVSEDFNKIVSAGYASGLEDSQIPEFLSGIQQVMEDGIAKGFSRSATDVASTLLMFSKMSGGDAFWQGEQGAKLLNQANNGIASATALSKTEDILVYSAMKRAYQGKDLQNDVLKGSFVSGADYVNTMQLIEKGITPDNLSAIIGSLDVYGNDKDAKIEALKNMTGLNYTGAARLFNLDVNSKTYEADLKNILSDPENQNNETKYQEAMNDIKEAVVKIGKGAAELKIASMDKVADGVQALVNKFVGTSIVDLSVDMGTDAENIKEVSEVHNPGNAKKHWGFKLASVSDDALGGWSAAEGPVWELENKIMNKQNVIDLLRADEFGSKVSELSGNDSAMADEFYRYLFDEPTEKVGDFIGEVSYRSLDNYLYQGERNTIIQKLEQIYQEFKQGLTLNTTE